MRSEEFPFVLSPNLGCPRIVELKGNKPSISLIVAGQYGDMVTPTKGVFKNLFKLIPSYEGEGKEIELVVTEDPIELSDWDKIFDFSTTEDTLTLVNSEVHYNVLGEGTRYWKLNASLESGKTNGLLRENVVNGKKLKLPTLYDLVTIREPGKYNRINYHAVQLVNEIKTGDCEFLHITDAHVARRNDEMLAEVVKVANKRTEQEIDASFINFNQNFRDVIHIANDLADKGELDFAVITGDMVDFSHHGWEDEVNPDENNYKEFLDIIVGRGNESAAWHNEGLKIALFTTTGNHDWRMHPYGPAMGRASTFGLGSREAKNYPYHSFDATEFPEDPRAKLARQISSAELNKLNLDTFNTRDRWKIRIGKLAGKIYSSDLIRGSLNKFIPGAGLLSLITHSMVDPAPWQAEFSTFTAHYIPIIAALISFGIDQLAKYVTAQVADLLVDNPLHAEAKALHYYFSHINPHLNYAFSYGNNHFILMDSGSDVFVGDLLDGKQVRQLKKLSITDNLIGGSPDSRAFDSTEWYYNWSQIVWLQKALNTKSIQENDNVFIGMHAPPVNVPDILYRDLPWWRKIYRQIEKLIFRKATIYDKVTSWSDIWESNPHKKIKHDWIAKNEIDLSYGTINHFVSQFFFLCLGLTEAQNRNQPVQQIKRKVPMVISGHAHRNIEFSLWLEWNRKKRENSIKIFSDLYSNPPANLGDDWKQRTLLIQTAACGLTGDEDKEPPYYRRIKIQRGEIKSFKVHSPKTQTRN